MNGKLVSVVIPNYNYARFLPDAIDSVLRQSYPHVEVIVVDNGSTDDSRDVLARYGAQVRAVFQENRGQAGSRNRGVEEARGDFVAFLDADDVWLSQKLERQLPLFAEHEVGLVYSGCTITDSSLTPIEESYPVSRGRVLRDFTQGGRGVVLAGESTAIVRRECFDRVGLFDPQLSISTGWDMWRRIAAHYAIEFVAEPLVLYRQHGTNATGRLDIWEHDSIVSLDKMFADPTGVEVEALRDEAYGRTYLMLAGSHYKQRAWAKACRYGIKGVYRWPPGIAQVLALPIRWLRRRRAGAATL